jgi:hypothetical protein
VLSGLQGTFGIIQGTFGIIQGTFCILQGTFGILHGTFGIIHTYRGVVLAGLLLQMPLHFALHIRAGGEIVQRKRRHLEGSER